MKLPAIQWLEIVRFELVNQVRRGSLWFLFALFLFPLFGIITTSLMDARTHELVFNAPFHLAEYGLIVSTIGLLLMAVVAGDAATRDIHTRIEPLMNAAPLNRGAYVGGRFFGAFLTVAVILAVIPIAQLLVPHFNPGVSAEVVGQVRAAAYLQTYFLLIIPNAFVGTALLFALGTLVRHTVGSYGGALLVFAAMLLSLTFIGGRLGQWDLASLLDSTGFTALSVMSRSWTPIELNERLIASETTLLWNRLLWIGIALAVLAFVIRRFRFGATTASGRWWQRGARFSRERSSPLHENAGGYSRCHSERSEESGWGNPHRETPRPDSSVAPEALHPFVAPLPQGRRNDRKVAHTASTVIRRTTLNFGLQARVRQTVAVARDSLRELETPWLLLVLPLLALKVFVTIDAITSMGAAGTRIFPTTGRVLAPLDDVAPPILIAIILFPVIIAGEMLWRERDANMQSLVDSTPVSNGVRFAGKILGLWSVMVVVHVLLMLAAVVAQVSLGWYDFDPALLFQIVLGLELVDAVVFSLFALSVHAMVNQKHVGHLLVMFLIAAANLTAEQFSVEHPLLLLGFEPEWSYSAISGFDPFLGAVLSFEVYWASWALLLALVARLFWVRGTERGIIARLRLARRRISPGAGGAIAAAVGLILLTGGFIFYNTNVLNAYETADQIVQQKAEYERRYGRYADASQPQLTAAQLHVELWPNRRAAEVRGLHELVNRTDQRIDMLHVAVSSIVETDEIELDRPARAALLDDELRHRIYELDEPLQPGESVRMSWQVRHDPRGFPAGAISTAVVENGSFFVMQDWMPLIGYQPQRELTDAAKRKELGLPEPRQLPPAYDVAARHDPRGRERIDLDITIGTSAEQIAVTSGKLQRNWTRDGRRYFHYATAAPVGNDYAIFSADYAVRRSAVEVPSAGSGQAPSAGSGQDVAIEIFHHPEHDMNVDRMIRSMEVSLEQFTERFGPYPYEVLRMVEYPSEGGSLHASSGIIWYKERFSLMDPENEPRRIDMPFAVVAHEVAHQFQPVPARAEGIALLSESFAWYAALGVIEQEYGSEHLQRFLGFMREAYLGPLAGVPLLRASNWFLGYRKGPLAMYALREYAGQERVDLAWRRLRAKHASFDPPFATSLDLYRELKLDTPEPLHSLLADLLERNTFWELKMTEATAQATSGGAWQVSLEIEARKVVVDENGAETEVAMDELIEIGIFAPAEAGEERGQPLYIQKHRIRSGGQTITLTVPARPASAGIDPRHLLVDVEPKDNVVKISAPS